MHERRPEGEVRGARREARGGPQARRRRRPCKDALFAWDASPISTGRLCAEVFEAIRDIDRLLASTTVAIS